MFISIYACIYFLYCLPEPLQFLLLSFLVLVQLWIKIATLVRLRFYFQCCTYIIT